MPQNIRTLPLSEHFTVNEIASGVYALIASAGGGAGSNAGIIDLGDQILVFDTFMTPLAAGDLKKACEQLTGRLPTWVINSHAHSDHVCGNQVFSAQIPILSTLSTRQAIPGMTAYLMELKANPANLEKELQADLSRLEKETDPDQCARLSTAVSRQRFSLASLAILDIRLPDTTFENEIVFSGQKRTAILRAQGKGHTDGDACLFLREEQVIFLGDLGFFQTQPFMASCTPGAWLKQLEDFKKTDFQCFVPGHGPVGTKADLTQMIAYITSIDQLVAQVHTQGKSVEELLQLPVPAPYDAASPNERRRFERNLRALYQMGE
jgi:cyclase